MPSRSTSPNRVTAGVGPVIETMNTRLVARDSRGTVLPAHHASRSQNEVTKDVADKDCDEESDGLDDESDGLDDGSDGFEDGSDEEDDQPIVRAFRPQFPDYFDVETGRTHRVPTCSRWGLPPQAQGTS